MTTSTGSEVKQEQGASVQQASGGKTSYAGALKQTPSYAQALRQKPSQNLPPSSAHFQVSFTFQFCLDISLCYR